MLPLDVFFPVTCSPRRAATSAICRFHRSSRSCWPTCPALSCLRFWQSRSQKLIGLNEDETLVFTRGVAYPNNGFVGIPLCSAVFGTEGTVLGSLSVPCATIYMFLFVMQSFRRDKSRIWANSSRA